MAEPLFSIYQPFTARRLLRSIAANLVINTVIALIITAIGVGKGFTVTFIFSQCIGFSIFGANLAVLPFYRRLRRSGSQALLIVTAIIAGALVGTMLGALANGIDPLLFFRDRSDYFLQILIFALLFGFVISGMSIALALLSEEKVRRLELEKTAVEAELRLLQSQIEPHFLFNTLSNVLGLIDTDKDRARSMLESFTSFLRASLVASREKTVPLGQEMDTIRSYLDIFTVRMGTRLRYRIDIPDDIRQCRVPPLLLQPLVENAVKHGLEPSVGGGVISIIGERIPGRVRITVSDTGIGLHEKSAGTGVGLENVRKRLELLHGSAGTLVLEENEPTGVKVSIHIPYEANSGDHS
ncbi:MAG: histidine kinase [Nitrospirota bacterium]|nr:histidine kinase [Nitrospirota bacterium]